MFINIHIELCVHPWKLLFHQYEISSWHSEKSHLPSLNRVKNLLIQEFQFASLRIDIPCLM